jgi:hypothetical protein
LLELAKQSLFNIETLLFCALSASFVLLVVNLQKNFFILNPCYQCVKKNNKKKAKKRIKKPCGNKKDFYFCTRIRAEVHTQTEGLNKSKKLLKKVEKRFG